MLSTATEVLIFALPYAALTAGGAALWRRLHSTATLMMTLGFGLAFLGQAVDHFQRVELSAVMRAHADSTMFLVAHYRALPLLIHYMGLCGLWAAAAGWVWHASQER